MKRLRIFYAAQRGCVSIPSSNLWEANLYQPLVDLGHDVVPLQYDLMPHFRNLDPSNSEMRAFIEHNRPKLECALLEQIEREHKRKPIDVFFSYFYSACVRRRVVESIRDMDICTINWYCNSSYQFHLVKDIAPAYDYCLVPEKFRLDDYRRAGANPIYCQEAANPNIYKPYNVPIEYDVTFVGAKYGDRPEYIWHLYDQGIDIRVWGPRWVEKQQPVCTRERWVTNLARQLAPYNVARAVKRKLLSLSTSAGLGRKEVPVTIPPEIVGPPLADEELIKMYSRSKISLGFSNVGQTHLTDNPIKQVRLRDFEAPMSGAFYMTEYMEELEEFFDISGEIVCYHDKEDLADKVKYYLSHDSARERIRKAGRKRCLSEHTWHKRFEMVFRETGLV